MPAYNNVILVHPAKLTETNSINMNYIYKLEAYCNGDIDWTKETLEEDIEWFRLNRVKIMDAIPPVNTKKKNRSKSPMDEPVCYFYRFRLF